MFLFLQWRDNRLLVSGTLFIKNPPLHSYNFLNFLYNKIYPLLSDIEIRDILLSLRVCFKSTMLWNLGFTVCNPPECMQMTVLLNLYGRRIQCLQVAEGRVNSTYKHDQVTAVLPTLLNCPLDNEKGQYKKVLAHRRWSMHTGFPGAFHVYP